MKSMKMTLLLGLLVLILAGGGCTRTYEAEVISLPCCGGRLIVHERYIKGMTSTVRFELRHVAGGNQRLVDARKHHVTLYTRPAPEERYHVLGNSLPESITRSRFSQSYPWAVFVDPNLFTPEEYEQIRQALADNLPAIDAALAQPREPRLSLAYERQPVIVSIRYVDYEAFRRVYRGPDPYVVEVHPDGRVTMRRPSSVGGTVTSLVGYVVDDGRRVLVGPASAQPSWSTWSPAEVQRCADARGRTLYDDFEVIVAENQDSFEDQVARTRDREAKFHEITRD